MIYLDNSATTKPFIEVVQAINDANLNHWYNASGSTSSSKSEMQHIEKVRQLFADDLNCNPNEIYFTGSGCEANNFAIRGILDKNQDKYLFYFSLLDHSSVIEFAKKNNSYEIIGYDQYGNVNLDLLENDLSKASRFNKVPFVTMAIANSEIGTIQNIKEITRIVHKYNGIFHADAVQLFPEQRIDVQENNIDMLSISGQKFHGPKGIGILYVNRNINISPIIYGTQEHGLRGGTYNAPLIYGLEQALIKTRTENKNNYVKELRNYFYEQLSKIPNIKLNGPDFNKNRLFNNISLTIKEVPSDLLISLCDSMGIVIAKGSACQASNKVLSSTLKAIGLKEDEILSTVRITLDQFNTYEEIDQASRIIKKLIERIRYE